jgi:hypothetical protein
MRDALDDVKSEEQIHVTQSRAAPDLPSLITEVDRHSVHMTMILDDMRGHMSSMEQCSGTGTMTSMRDEMQVEVDSHQTTMHTMHELMAARAEEEHHITMMSAMIDDMDVQLDSMHCGMW